VYKLDTGPFCVVKREAELLSKIRGSNLDNKTSFNTLITTKEQNGLRPDFFQPF
jgi:hypothetical protein